VFAIREFRFPEDYPAVLSLWQAAGPGVRVGRSDSFEEIEKKWRHAPDLFLVAETDGRLIGSVIGGYDGRRGLLYHLAVSADQRGQGIGEALMNEIEDRLRAKGCVKAYLLVTPDNLAVMEYYAKRGWAEMDVTIMGKNLS
jgi:ribosomal protein S18 acetylase RimI-like enzyme